MSWTKPTFQTFDMRVITMRSLFLSFWFLGKSKEFSVPRFRGLLEELGLFVNVIGIVPGASQLTALLYRQALPINAIASEQAMWFYAKWLLKRSSY